MRDTIELIEMSELVNAVVATVFPANEVTGQIDYRPEYVEVVRAFFEMKYYAPDELESKNIDDFYMEWINGKYKDILDKINPRQSDDINSSIWDKIEYVKAQVGNPLNNALSSLINVIQDGIDMFTSSFGDLTMEDVRKVMMQADNFTKNIDKNAKGIVKAVTENIAEKTAIKNKKNKNIVLADKNKESDADGKQ